MKVKKIRILTYCCWTSFGSILQSYALSKTLLDLGYKNTIWLENWNREIYKPAPKNAKDILKYIYSFFNNKKINNAHKKRQDFILNNLDVEYFPDDEAFVKKASENTDDIYLAGSDQIWNPDRCNPLFFLDFVKSSKKISYAASMGNTTIVPGKVEKYRNWLNDFDRISVREQTCAQTLQQLTDKEIQVNIDPTFLIGADEWRKIEKPYKVNEPYILLYMLYWDNSLKRKIEGLKKRTGLPVYAVCPYISRVNADRCLYDVGVDEFLWLVDHAEYVVASSFHGVAFSLIFQKRFAAVINPKQSSRIDNLFEMLSIPRIGIDELDSKASFDYGSVMKKTEEERRRSMEYLKEAIG